MVDGYLHNNILKFMKEEENICMKIRDSTKKLPPDQIPSVNKEVVE